MVWALVLLPPGAGLILAGRARRPLAVGAGAAAGLAATLAVAAWAAATGAAGAWRWSAALGLHLDVTGVSRVMVVLVPAVAIPVVAYSAASEADDPALGRLVGLLVAFVGAMELLVGAADFLTLLVGWELVGACSWALIAHHWRQDGPPRSATTAFLTTRVGDLGLYLAAAAAFAGSRSFAFAALPAGGWPLHVVAAGVLVAAAAKSAQVPFSPWLFAAMDGPTPVSALLHSATMVAAGAYAVAKLAPALLATGWFGPAVAGLGLASALAGGLVACVQDDAKRVLAASTTAQYGLMLVAVGAGSTGAALAHLVTHAAFKSLLFLGAGFAIHAAGTGDLARLRLGRAERVAAALFAVGTLALAAVPPFGGAASKETVLAAAASRWVWAGAGVALAGVLSAFYAARLQLLAYGPGAARPRAPVDGSQQVAAGGSQPAPVGSSQQVAGGSSAEVAGGGRRTVELAAIGVLAAASVGLGLLWLPAGRQALERLAGVRVPRGDAAELVVSLASVAIGLSAAGALDRSGRLLDLGLAPARRKAAADWLGLPTLAGTMVVGPVLTLARALARFDDRVVDAGVRGAARVADALAGLLSWWGERGLDGVVEGIAGAAVLTARAARAHTERVVDAAVEGLAGAVGLAGGRIRRLQSGLAHHYYVIAVAGLVTMVLAAVLGRS